METVIIIYVLWNVITYNIMRSDKLRAKKHAWRIPEKTLFLIAFFGGAAGVYVAMWVHHHKTRHLSFLFFIPVFLVLNIALLRFIVHHII